jgi:RNA polymerase sigma-70 factor, ECF subfamily
MDKTQRKFGSIYDKYVSKVYLFIYLKVDSRETAEDLTSRVFTKSWDKFKEKEKIRNIRAYIYQIARNEVVDYYRYRDKSGFVSLETEELESKEIVDSNQDIENKAALSRDIEETKKALASLKEDYQNVIIWRYLDNLAIKEIAEIMNKPQGTVRVMIYRALKDLKEKLT